MTTVYLAGPMTGLPDYNRAAFAAAEKCWCGYGRVLNPARHELGFDHHEYMKLAFQDILASDAVVVLDGWERSPGATIEVIVANALAMPIYEDAHPLGSIRSARAENLEDAFRHENWLPLLVDDPFERELAAIGELHSAKRADYTGGSGDRLANYRFSSEAIGVSTLAGMFMRFSEKYYRAKQLLRPGAEAKVKDESIADTFRDLAIISILMRLAASNEPGYGS